MDKVYYASCFTGAHCNGVYTTLELAQKSIETHYNCMVMQSPDNWTEDHMRWVQLHDSWAWVPVTFQPEHGNPFAFNNTPDGLMENCTVQEVELDAALPFVSLRMWS